MKKVGILTMYYRRNYGGILQSLALYKVLETMGYSVELINFRESETTLKHIRNRIFLLKALLNKDLLFQRINEWILNWRKKRKENPQSLYTAFEKFKEGNILIYSIKVDEFSISTILGKYDLIVVGSDQVWSDLGKKQLPFMLDFPTLDYKGKIIAYAACSSYNIVPMYNREKVRMCLSKFSAVSVRDTNTYNLIRDYCEKTPAIVADPSALYDYKAIIDEKPLYSEPYMFVYILGSEIKGGQNEFIKRLKQKYKIERVVAIAISNVSLEAEKIADKIYYDASPTMWINLLYHATLIYTDSFHGCMFSLKYKKEFIAYYVCQSRASRLLHLKEKFHLSNIISSVEEYDLISTLLIDYNKVYPIFEQYKNESLKFLCESLTC